MTEKARRAVAIGTLCSISYLAVYLARNVLGAVTPQMLLENYSSEYIGSMTSMYFISYAVGQLINGYFGDKIKARYMLSIGLLAAGLCTAIFPYLGSSRPVQFAAYAASGFFLSMIYGPMTKTVAENVGPLLAARCSLGYTLASFLGSPAAGALAAVASWQAVFGVGGFSLLIMGVICFIAFLFFEKRGMVCYGQFARHKGEKGALRVLFKRRIIKFSLVSAITGVVRTSVVFWMPTYFSQRLGYSPNTSAAIFTVTTLIISSAAFISLFLYERLFKNIDLTLFVFFVISAAGFFLVYFVENRVVNIALLVIAILSSNSAASLLWSRYCPSLHDTGFVSGVTGFLDFISYMGATIANYVFAGADKFGWGNIVLIWFGIVMLGVVVSAVRANFKSDDVYFGNEKE